jgi:hypothetical protein
MTESISTRGELPSSQLRGIDSPFFMRREPSIVRLVRAPCEEVVDILVQEAHVDRDIVDPLSSPVIVSSEEIDRSFFIFQLAGNSWTQIAPRVSYPHDWLENWLSQELNRGTLIFTLRNGYQYSLYESTHCFTESAHEIEFFSEAGPEYYEYSGEFFGKVASNAFQMTKLDYACLFTKRDNCLDIESPGQVPAFVSRVAGELGIYAAFNVFQLDGSGKPRLMEPWHHTDIRAARLLRLVTQNEWERRVFGDSDEEEKLKITPRPRSLRTDAAYGPRRIPVEVPPEFEELFRECEALALKHRQRG